MNQRTEISLTRMIVRAEKGGCSAGAALGVVGDILREIADQLFEELLNHHVQPGMVVRPNVIPEVIRGWTVDLDEIRRQRRASDGGEG